MGKLTAAFCATVKEPGKYGDADGLMLAVSPKGAKRWVQRIVIRGKRRDLALGAFPQVGLAEARRIADENRRVARAGGDPTVEAQRQAGIPTFAQAAEDLLAVQLKKFSNPKHRQQWENTLREYALPVLGQMRVDEIGVSDVARALEPIWTAKHETGSRLRGRIEKVLALAIVRGWRPEPNPARWANNLDLMLSAPAEATRVQHRPALRIEDTPAWFLELRKRQGFSARALEFAALCWSRSGEVRGATWSEIDLQRRIWTIPAERMKMGREHVVPLSNAAVGLLRGLPRVEGTDHVFPSGKGDALSDMALSAVMRKMHSAKVECDMATGIPETEAGWLDPRSRRPAVPHGLRSTARDWAGREGYPRELAEHALAHAVGNAVEAAYHRDTLAEQRRGMMSDWSRYLAGESSAAAGGISGLRAVK